MTNRKSEIKEIKKRKASAPTDAQSKHAAGSKRDKRPRYSNSANSQRQLLVKYFNEVQPNITVDESRKKLGILHVPARIFELRQQGHDIRTTWISQNDDLGSPHNVGLYSYHGKKRGGAKS